MRATEAGDIVIRARNVTLSFGSGTTRTDVLRGIDLDVPRGQSLAILGPSGSGKSSLMAVLSGLEQASGGEVRVAGNDLADSPPLGSAIASAIIQRSCRAASSSASPSPGLSPPAPRSSSPTSRPATSTRARVPRSSTCCSRGRQTAARPW
jgi:energy-coupling factor transporter ATP-binding protein EcfA2